MVEGMHNWRELCLKVQEKVKNGFMHELHIYI